MPAFVAHDHAMASELTTALIRCPFAISSSPQRTSTLPSPIRSDSSAVIVLLPSEYLQRRKTRNPCAAERKRSKKCQCLRALHGLMKKNAEKVVRETKRHSKYSAYFMSRCSNRIG